MNCTICANDHIIADIEEETTERSWTCDEDPTRVGSPKSPRKTVPYHADEPLPTATSPAIMALGAMKAACAEFGAAFATATAVVEGKVFATSPILPCNPTPKASKARPATLKMPDNDI